MNYSVAVLVQFGLLGLDLNRGSQVMLELRFEGLDRLERPDAAKPREEFELQRLAVKIAGEADEVGFDLQRVLAERGIGADVDRGGPVARGSEGRAA